MGRLLGLLSSCILYFCVATVLAQMVGFTVLWQKGHLSSEKVGNVLEAAYGLNATAAPADQAVDEKEVQVAYADILEKRALISLDIDLRETALDNAATDLLNRSAKLNDAREKYEQVLVSFDRQLAELRAGATDRAIQDVRQTLETMRPEQAKQQLILMLADNRIDEVVTILKSMSREFRKKILVEFQPDENDKLYSLIEEILSGSGEGDLIDAAEQQVEQFQGS